MAARKKLPVVPAHSDADASPDDQQHFVKGPVCDGCPLHDMPRIAGMGESPTDIMLVSESPTWASVNNHSHFMGKGGRIIKETWKKLVALDVNSGGKLGFAKLNKFDTYAVQCQSEPEDLSQSIIDRCGTYLLSAIRHKKPKIIVTFGAKALKAVGIKAGKFDETRGRLLHTSVGGEQFLVIPTFSVRALLKSSGLYNLFHGDMLRAMRIATQVDEVQMNTPIAELTSNYRIPRTVEEVKAVCEEILAYAVEGAVPGNSAIAVDTETNTLLPHAPGAKVLCISFAWDTGKATAIPLWHKDAPYAAEDVLPYIRAVLESEKPKVFHNAKYDLKFLELTHGLRVNNVAWCTLLGEHLIREDQSGSYSLKVLGRSYFPQFANYADHIHEVASALGEHDLLAEQELTLFSGKKAKLRKIEVVEVAAEEPPRSTAVEPGDDATAEELSAWLDALTLDMAAKPKAKRAKRTKKVVEEVVVVQGAEELGDIPSLTKAEIVAHVQGSKKEQNKKIKEAVNYEKVELYGDEGLLVYAAVDTDLTRRLLRNQFLRMKEEDFLSQGRSLMKTHAVPASRVLGKMEYGGVKVDRDYLSYLDEKLGAVIEQKSKEISRHWLPSWGEFNPNSTQQLGKLLYSEGVFDSSGERRLRLIPGIVDMNEKSRQWKTDKKTLRGIVEYTEKNSGEPCPFTVSLLDYRTAHKVKNGFLVEIRNLSELDQYLHTNYNIHGTSTGRTSSNGINMQNWPSWSAGFNIKKLLITDNPEEDLFVNLDYKGAEIRIFAAYSNDERLINALLDGMDAHCFFTSAVYEMPYEEVLAAANDTHPDKKKAKYIKSLRTIIKRVVFGILYGAGAHKIAETATITLEKAQEVINLLMSMFPSIRSYVEETRDFIRRYGFVETFFGRRRRFPLHGVGSFFRSQADRRGVNMKIQSTSSDIVISQLVELDEHVQEVGGRIVLTVHDSIGLLVKRKYVEQLPDFLQHYCVTRVKEKYPWLPVPFSCDIEVGDSYGEVTKLSDFIAAKKAKELSKAKQLEVQFDEEAMEELRDFENQQVESLRSA